MKTPNRNLPSGSKGATKDQAASDDSCGLHLSLVVYCDSVGVIGLYVIPGPCDTMEARLVGLILCGICGSTWLLHNMDVTKTMLIALVTPVVAVVLGMIVLDEELGWRTIVGGGLIMLGIDLTVAQGLLKNKDALVIAG